MLALDFFLSIESEVTPTVNVPSAHILRAVECDKVATRWRRRRVWGNRDLWIYTSIYIFYARKGSASLPPSCLAHNEPDT